MLPGLGVVAILLAAPSSPKDESQLNPEIMLNGKPHQGACGVVARGPAQKVFESVNGSALSVPPSVYQVAVTCKVNGSDLVLAPFIARVKMGETFDRRIEVYEARVRVESRRNNIMLPSKVHFYQPSAKLKGSPLFTLPSNQKKTIAAGRYDIVVELSDPESPRASMIFKKSKIKKSRTTVLKANLSDGGLIAKAKANGKNATGSVKAYHPDDQQDIALVETGEELRLPAGRYIIKTELRDTADFSTRSREVWIKAGKLKRLTESFQTGLLTVTVTKDKKPVDATVRLSKKGAADFFNYFSAPGTVTLSPGVYDLTVNSHAAGPLGSVVERNITVKRKRNTKKILDLSPAAVVVKIMKNGKVIDAEVLFRRAGGGETIEPKENGSFRVWPGRYEVVGRLDTGDEIVDGPFEVTLGQRLTRTLSFKRATLTVVAERGTAMAQDAEFFVFRPGATRPTVRARSGAQVDLVPALYDVKVVAGPDTVWRQGVRVNLQRTLRIALPLSQKTEEDALPEGDAPEELPGGDPEHKSTPLDGGTSQSRG